MAWPTFIPKGWEIDTQQPVAVGDVVTVSLGARRQRYVITAIHDDDTVDLTIENAT